MTDLPPPPKPDDDPSEPSPMSSVQPPASAAPHLAGERPVTINRASAARSAMWSVLENGGLAVISFVSLIIYSRFLSISDFGLFSIVLAVIELLSVLVSMLFHDALVQRKDVSELHYDTAFTATLGLSAVLLGGCWLLAPLFASRTGNADAAPVLMWTAVSLPLTALSATIVARQRRELQFRALALRSLIGRSLGAAIGIVLVVAFHAAFWGLVAQQVLVVFFGSLVLWVLCRQRPRIRFGAREFRELIRFGSFSVGALFLGFSIKRSFVVLSGIALGTHAAGLLNLSFRAVDTFWTLSATAIQQIALPILAKLRSDDERFVRAFRAATAFNCLTLYFLFVMLSAVSLELVELLFGAQWLAIRPYVTVLALLGMVQASRMLASPLLTAVGRPRDLLLSQGIELAMVLAAIFITGVPTVGTAIAIWMAREVIGGVFLAWLLRRATGLGLREHLISAWMPMLCGAAMWAAIWALRPLLPADWIAAARLAVLAPAGALVYLTCAFVLNRALVMELLHFARSALHRRKPGGPA